jgi:2-methylcitrate dehydratase PrpD
VRRPDVKAMIEKIDFVVDEQAEAAGYHKMTTLIDIELADGRKVCGRADFGKGSPANPMSYDEVADKFRENAAFAKFPSARAESVVKMVRELETLPSIGQLTAALARAGSTA